MDQSFSYLLCTDFQHFFSASESTDSELLKRYFITKSMGFKFVQMIEELR